MRLKKPIVLLELKGPGQSFSFDNATALLSDIEQRMPALNPWCIPELRTHLKNEPLSTLQETVMQALQIGRAARVNQLNINGHAATMQTRVILPHIKSDTILMVAL